jgi:hypothetical protein
MATNEKQTHHKTIGIKPCSLVGKKNVTLQLDEIPLKGLAKAKILLAPRIQAIDPRM